MTQGLKQMREGLLMALWTQEKTPQSLAPLPVAHLLLLLGPALAGLPQMLVGLKAFLLPHLLYLRVATNRVVLSNQVG
jgi:uncharacterized membrane protein YhhN